MVTENNSKRMSSERGRGEGGEVIDKMAELRDEMIVKEGGKIDKWTD